MDYFLYKLNFTTALHIGTDSGGASLDDGQMTIHADTIFAALCCEAIKQGKIEELYAYFNEGSLTISDALPYQNDELYLPKPVLNVNTKKRERDASSRKALKALEFIPLSAFKDYMQTLNRTEFNPDKFSGTFGNMSVSSRVAIKGQTAPLPYHVAAWRFNPGCGLYIIMRSEQSPALKLFTNLLASLGISGIGGKQSSGWGKFEIRQTQPPDNLLDMLNDSVAQYQMLLGTALPVDDELEEALSNSWYTLVRRGGFIRSETYAPGQLKKRTIYMLGPGSCLRSRFKGGMFDLSDNGNHPIWRNGNTLFVGVNI
jgi:CRISPR-associated protein Csm4